jgi:hypothetical protein
MSDGWDMGAVRNYCNILVEKYEQKRQPGKPRDIHKDNTKMNHRATVCERVDLIAQYNGKPLGNVLTS